MERSMRRYARKEFTLTLGEINLILRKRRKEARAFARKQQRINSLNKLMDNVCERLNPLWQRVGGTLMILCGMLAFTLSNNKPGNEEVTFTAIVVVIVGLLFLLTKHDLTKYDDSEGV